GGRDAGASQPHRHLQLVPRGSIGRLPLEDVVQGSVDAGRVAGWPVPHRVARPGFAEYRAALAAVGRDPDRPGPHSLLRTRDWQLVVPRRPGSVGGIPVNSLGYLGLLAVRDAEQLARVRAEGPWSILAAAAAPDGDAGPDAG